MTVTAAERKLSASSTTAERVEALASILGPRLVARATGVTSNAVRNWIEGAEPRADAAMTIDDLRSLVGALLDGGFEPERVRSWLVSRNDEWLDGQRPIEEISRIPLVVHGAARDALAVHRFGPEAAASIEGGPFPPTTDAASSDD